MDAIGYIKRNKKQIERNSLENWVDMKIEQIIDLFIKVIEMTKARKEDKEGTNQFYDSWLRSLKPEYEGFFRQWLIRAFDGDLSFVYARNALIRSLNRDMPRKNNQQTVPQINTKIWEWYLKLRDYQDLNFLNEEIHHYFPNIDERHQFLSFAILQHKKDFPKHEPSNDSKFLLIKDLLSETGKKVEETSFVAEKKRDKSNATPLAEYDNGTAYVELFKEPDSDVSAELVKVVLDDMGLTKNGRLADNLNIEPTSETISSKDTLKVNKNTLAYVFAALEDLENEIRIIRHDNKKNLLTIFYQEFGINVAETSSSGDVTMRNIRKVLLNENRSKNPVYKDFSLRYKEKLKERKLI